MNSSSSSLRLSLSSSDAITDEEFNLLHSNDRKLFFYLINDLSIDVNDSIHLVGFLLWLEEDHIKDFSIIHTILQLSYQMLNQVVEETLSCLKLIDNDVIQPENVVMEFHFLETLTDKSFSSQQLHDNRVTIWLGISRMINEVCLRAFCDILEDYLKTHEPIHVQQHVYFGDMGEIFGPLRRGSVIAHVPISSMGGPSKLIGHGVDIMSVMGELSDWLASLVIPGKFGLAQGGNYKLFEPPHFYHGPTPFLRGMQFQEFVYPVQFQEPAYPVQYQETAYQVQFLGNMTGFPEGQMHMMGNNLFNNQMFVEEYDDKVDADMKTIFLTFSKGYPISKEEVWEFFTRRFGHFIESIQMQEVEGDEQVLYARVIAKSVAMMDCVVNSHRAKYYINGKHVCVRKFVHNQKSARSKRANSV